MFLNPDLNSVQPGNAQTFGVDGSGDKMVLGEDSSDVEAIWVVCPLFFKLFL